jgi:hypothetical protein
VAAGPPQDHADPEAETRPISEAFTGGEGLCGTAGVVGLVPPLPADVQGRAGVAVYFCSTMRPSTAGDTVPFAVM